MEKQVAGLNGAKLSALSGQLASIANPRFNWQPGIRQIDDLTNRIKKGKLSIGEYFDAWRNGQEKLIQQQNRLSQAFATPLGSKGAMAMTIPSASAIESSVSATQKLNNQLAVQSQLLTGLGTKVQDWGKNTQWAGRQLTVGLTMPIAMAAAAAGKYAYDIDMSLTRIEKVYDGSTQGLREMATESAMSITQSLGTTVKSSLDSMAELAAAGKQGKEMLDLAYQAQRISVLGNVDQAESIKSVISMQAIYQQSTQDVANAVNYLNYVDSQTPTSMGEIIDAIPIAGATVKQLGGDIKDTTVLLTAFKERGISTVEGANAIKTAMNRILAPTKATRDLFQQLTGKSLPELVKSTEGKPVETFQALSDAIIQGNLSLAEQQQLIGKLAGIYQSSRITSLLQSLADPNSATAKTKQISERSDAELAAIAEKHQKAITESASGQFRIAVESFKAQLKEFGDTALKVATAVVQGFGKALELFNAMPEPIKMTLVAIGGFLAIAGPITMLVGLFANLAGSVIKFGGFLTQLKTKTKMVTVEEKAAQIAADQMKVSMLSEAEAAQILVLQLGKVVGALQAIDTQAGKTAATMNRSSTGVSLTSFGAPSIVRGQQGAYLWDERNQTWITNTKKPLTAEQREDLSTQLAMVNATKQQAQAQDDVATAASKTADATEKSSRFAKAFNTESMLGVSAVAGIASMATDAESSFSKWMNYISLGALALSGIIPVIKKVGETAVAQNLMGKLLGATSGAGGIGGMASKLGNGIKGMLTGALSGVAKVITSPLGLLASAAIIPTLGVYKLLSAESEKQEEIHQNIIRSTDMWTTALGRTKVEWGQIKTDSGEVKNTIDGIAEKLKANAGPLVESFRGMKDLNELKWMANVQVGNLMGQGMSKEEIQESMRALLTAAGKTHNEIEQIMTNISVTFDFRDGEKDFNGFMDTVKKKLNALNFDLLGDNAVQYDSEGLPSISGDSFQNLKRQTDELKQMFWDRAASMDDVEKAVFAKQFSDSMSAAYEAAFQDLNSKAGGKLGKDLAEARSKFLQFDKKTGDYNISDLGLSALPADTAQKLANLANEEADLAQAIAKARGASDEQAFSIQTMGDLLPFVTQNVGDAKTVQQSYNDAVKQAEATGRKMTDAEKLKLATVYASVSGLDAATIAANGYANANQNSTDKIRENAQSLQAWLADLKNVSAQAADAWNEVAMPGTEEGSGFGGIWQDVLGNSSTNQAKALTDRIKGIYSGTMDDVYEAYAGAAEDIWQQRLDNITKSFERRKDALQAQIDAFDKAYQAKQQEFSDRWDQTMQDFNDRWDEVMNNTKKSFDNRQKAIENEAESRIEAIDQQIDAIKDQQEKEQELEEQRKKQFEAEKQRIERMAELANRRIDYNKALFGGNLDEAARVQNNTESLVLGWSIDDANARAEDRAAQKSKMTDKQIEQLEGQKEMIQKQKEAQLEALREEEQALEESLQKQREMERRSLEARREAEQRAMEASKEIERQRLQDRLDSLNREQQATEATERAKQEMNRRTLEIELATLKTFVPQNEAELNAHINRVGGAYGEFGITLQGAGSIWGQIVANALQNNVDRARGEMANDALWAQFGQSVANAISQGAFGLNLTDFMNLLRTGNPPPGWQPPAPAFIPSGSSLTPNSGNGGRGMIARHAGGPVDSSPGSRNGRGNSPLGSDEYMSVLQQGEFVINKQAVQTFGTENLARINAGQPFNRDPGVSLAGAFGGMAAIMGNLMSQVAVKRLADHYAMKNTNVAMALGYMGQGVADALAFAQAQDGKPYIWGASGPHGYDCSGYMSAIANVLTGAPNPYKRIFSTGMMSPGKSLGPFVPGPGGPFEIGVKHGNPGHTAGTLAGINVESTGNHVRFGKDAHGSRDKQFTMLFHVPPEFVAGGFGGSGSPGGPVKETVRAVAQKYGWEAGIMWDALDWLIQHESSWNPNAQNPSSTAYGLFQFLDSTWASVGMAKTGDPRLQAEAGLRYIKQRYGNPLGAKNFWLGHHWYDKGGDLPPGLTMAYNGTNMTETVLTNGTTRAVIRALEHANYTYSGFKGVLKDALTVAAQPNLHGVGSGSGGDTYQFGDIYIDGSGLDAKELKKVISDTIDEKTRMAQKKRGQIK